MVALTRIPYINICIAAALPAMLYFFAISISLHLRAVRLDIKGIESEKKVDLISLLKKGFIYIFPVAMLIYALVILRLTPMRAALYATLLIPVVTIFYPDKRFNLSRTIEALSGAAHKSITIVISCALAGIVVGMIALTGLGATFGAGIVQASGGNMFLTLLFVAIGTVIMGMGLPTTAAYIITATIAAPALKRLGIPLLYAHLFFISLLFQL